MENNTLLVYTSYPKVLFDHAKKHNLIKEYLLNAQKVLNILLEDDGKLNNFLKDLTIEKADRKKIIEYAYERNKRYSMETFASRMEEVYNRALKKFW